MEAQLLEKTVFIFLNKEDTSYETYKYQHYKWKELIN